MTLPIYEATAWDHGFAPMLQEAAFADACYRCPTEPAGRIDPLEPDPGLCRACLDEVSHRVENARLAEVVWLGNGGDDDGRWV